MNLSAQFERLSFHETQSKSMLIDFGGISCYQCNINLSTNKKNLRLQKAFEAWRSVIYEKSKQYEKDIESILQFDHFVFQLYFQRWKDSYQDALFKKQQQAFKIWKIMTYTRIRERDNLRQKAIEAVIYWKNVAMRRVFSYNNDRRLKKRYFIQWAKFFKNQRKMLKIRARVNRVKLKQYMRIWRNRYRIHKNRTAEQKLHDRYHNKRLELMFDNWRILYAKKMLKSPVQNQMKRAFFTKWRKNLQIALIDRQNYTKIVQNRNNYLVVRAFSKFIHKYKLTIRRRKKRLVNLWARVVIREITYSRVQYMHAKILKNAAFRQMKLKLRQRQIEVKQEFFDIWVRYVQLQRKKKECQQVRISFALSRYFGRWQITYQRFKEEAEVKYVASRVVYAHLKQRAFMTWIIRAKDQIRKKNIIANRFRKRQLKIKFFKAWHNYSVMINVRAEQYFRHISMKKYFDAFAQVTLEIPRSKEQKAEDFYNQKLKKRYFDRFKSFINCDFQDDDNINELITLLNGRCSNLF